MDPDDDAFEATLAAQRGRRRERFERTVARLRELDLSIDDQLGRHRGSERRRARSPDRRPRARSRPATRRASRTRSRACSAGASPAYVPRTGLGPVEAIEAIRAAGGLPVLAHFGEAPARVDVVRELVEAGLGGLEVYYRSFDVATVAAVGEVAARARPRRRPAAATTTATPARTPRRTPALWVPPEVAAGVPRFAASVVGSPAQP